MEQSTIELAEQKIAALESCGLRNEQGEPLKAIAKMFSSGMGAISTLFISNLKPGDKDLAQGTLYGGTAELLVKLLSQHGVIPIIMDLKDLDLVEDHVMNDPKVKMLYIETPSNPTIDCYDIEALTKIAKKKNLVVAVDNTFASPYLQQPLKYGVDFVIHSTTKYLNGHGNSIGGMMVGRDETMMNKTILNTANSPAPQLR
jgi:methionine-gamma-lyase